MTESTDERIGLSLENLSSLASSVQPTPHFDRMSLNNAALTKLITGLTRADSGLGSVTAVDLLKIKRGAVLTISIVPTNIRFLIWSRQLAVAEHAAQALMSYRNGSIICSATSVRAILELIGNASLLEKKINSIGATADDDASVIEWIEKIDEVVDGRLLGVRVDYRKLIERGLRSNKKNSYKPSDDERNLEASELLDGVDQLGKKVVGSRNAYDFLSEFTHPNLASVWTHYDAMTLKMSLHDIHMYSVKHRAGQLGTEFLSTFGPVLVEAIEIVTDALREFHKITALLEDRASEVQNKARRVIRGMIKRDPKAFDRSESCPCNSGKNIQYCCGRLIKPKLFGNLSNFGVKFWSATQD